MVKQMFGYSYRDLAFHIAGSVSHSSVVKLGLGDKPFKHSALNKNIKMISPGAREEINRVLLDWSKIEGIEKGHQVRIDWTVVDS